MVANQVEGEEEVSINGDEGVFTIETDVEKEEKTKKKKVKKEKKKKNGEEQDPWDVVDEEDTSVAWKGLVYCGWMNGLIDG